MVHRVSHEVLVSVGLLAVAELGDLCGMTNPAVAGTHDDIDLESHVLEIVPVAVRIQAVAFIATNGVAGKPFEYSCCRDPAFEHRLLHRFVRKGPGVAARKPVFDNSWRVNLMTTD